MRQFVSNYLRKNAFKNAPVYIKLLIKNAFKNASVYIVKKSFIFIFYILYPTVNVDAKDLYLSTGKGLFEGFI